MKRKLISAVLMAITMAAQAQTPIYLDVNQPLEKRVEDALGRLTTHEKISMIHAQSKFSSPGVPRLGIPEIWCADGPHGVRSEVLWDEWNTANWTNDSITAFPALTCLAATWDPEMSMLYGKSVGAEARYRNKTVLLGPGVNICRSPLNGRSFEYMGEDPYLSSRMVVPYIQGVQSNGVAACVKHYAVNNNELTRFTSNVLVDERTLREIYLPAFEAAVKEGGAWTLMCSYNLFRGKWLSENDYLLNQVLKKEWGFDGAVISDWGAAHDTEGVVKGGLDLEYGSMTNGLTEGASNAYASYYMADAYEKMIQEGKIGTDELNDKVRRVLRTIFRTTMAANRPFGSQNSEAHVAAARAIGNAGIVLLKNDAPTKKGQPLLPINLNTTKKILVVGENAIKMMTIGGGSSSLKVQHEISPLQGLESRLAGKVEVAYERGYVGDPKVEQDGMVGQDLSDPRSAEQLIADAVAKAKDVDLVIFVGGLNKANQQDAESSDRIDYALPYGQDNVINALLAVNKNLVVVNISGNAVAMPWLKNVPALVQDWYLGSEAGNSLADVLLGDVNPSGKLPFTIYTGLEQVGAHVLGDWEGKPSSTGKAWEIMGYKVPVTDLQYNEGMFVGYRYIDQNKLKPIFPFGYGISYTTYAYGKPRINKSVINNGETVTITVPVTNTGKVAGSEVVQAYVQDVQSSVTRPTKELKAFKKVALQPGETKEVQLTIDKRAMSFYDDSKKDWVAEPGMFNVLIGANSQDIKGTVAFELK